VNRSSIRFRLTAWYAGILAVTFAAVGIGVWLAMRSTVYETVDKELRSRLGVMREFLQREAAQRENFADELLENAALAPAGTRFRIATENGRWLYQSPGTEKWGAAPDPKLLPSRGRFEVLTQNRTPIRVLSAVVPAGVIQIGMPIDEFLEMLDGFTWTALIASPLLLIGASIGGYWMARRALAPVGQIAQTAADIEAHNLAKRLPLSGSGDELDHLSETLNGMFARLDNAFRQITQFTADASHELRTPAAIIRTTAEVARRKPRTTAEYETALDRILAESVRNTALIDDLMLLARADSRAEDIGREAVPMAQLVREACHGADALARAAGIRLSTCELEECIVEGDPGALRRAVLILLDNAIKYSKPDGGLVEVRLDSPSNGRSTVVLEVRDNGIGIGPEDLPHIFERFYRASKDRSRKVEGVGLGLSIAQSIAHQHGGDLQIDSTPGAGTTARLVLPAR
jgi:heavy metal sensor kinase